jgi:hypothetical protein
VAELDDHQRIKKAPQEGRLRIQPEEQRRISYCLAVCRSLDIALDQTQQWFVCRRLTPLENITDLQGAFSEPRVQFSSLDWEPGEKSGRSESGMGLTLDILPYY